MFQGLSICLRVVVRGTGFRFLTLGSRAFRCSPLHPPSCSPTRPAWHQPGASCPLTSLPGAVLLNFATPVAQLQRGLLLLNLSSDRTLSPSPLKNLSSSSPKLPPFPPSTLLPGPPIPAPPSPAPAETTALTPHISLGCSVVFNFATPGAQLQRAAAYELLGVPQVGGGVLVPAWFSAACSPQDCA